MVTALEAPPDLLVKAVAEYLKTRVTEVRPPAWALMAKTGVHKEHPPMDPEWWYVRAASIMRKLYKARRPVGVERLRTAYGGRVNRGVAPEHFSKGSGSVIRVILQQLERAGLVERVKGRGRRLTPAGVSLLDNMAFNILRTLSNERPELRKYLPGKP